MSKSPVSWIQRDTDIVPLALRVEMNNNHNQGDNTRWKTQKVLFCPSLALRPTQTFFLYPRDIGLVPASSHIMVYPTSEFWITSVLIQNSLWTPQKNKIIVDAVNSFHNPRIESKRGTKGAVFRSWTSTQLSRSTCYTVFILLEYSCPYWTANLHVSNFGDSCQTVVSFFKAEDNP